MESEDFFVKLLNNYLIFYKSDNLCENGQTMFDDITEDDTSTNKQMEMLYSELILFKENNYDSEIVEYGSTISINSEKTDDKKNYEYCLMKNENPMYLSNSLMGIMIEMTGLQTKNDSGNYRLVRVS